ncbi:MAG: nucleotidyltransferase domain-containing protein [Flavobacteriales bacterium]
MNDMSAQLTSVKRTRMVEVFSRFDAIESVVLFGSRALGTARANSDIDLAIKGADIDATTPFKLATQLDDLLIPNEIDLVVYDRIQNDALREHIDRHGVEVYWKHET